MAHRDAEGPDGPRESLERAATPVRTSLLKDRGIESLRILSESQLLEILDRCMLARVAPASLFTSTPAPGTSPEPVPVPGSPASADVGHDDIGGAEECRKAWEARRALQARAVARLEAALQELAAAFEKLEGLRGDAFTCPGAAHSVKDREARPERDLTQRRRRLARDMTRR